jgi:GT2 family glycosyltransferase
MSISGIDVSVVVCTYNRAGLLRDALASLMALKTEEGCRYELVVVDNASTDETPRVIEESASRSPVPFRGVREDRPGVACARNRGVREALGPWIAFFDDDQVADPRWLLELLATAREKGARCVGGANRLLLPPEGREVGPLARGMLGETGEGGENPRRYSGNRIPGTGNLLLQRSIFEEVGGFDESLRTGGEDSDLVCRMRNAGIDAWFAPQAVMHHVVPAYRLTDEYLRWKSLGYGRNQAMPRFGGGRRAVPLHLPVRLGHALLVSMPRLLWARLRGDQKQAVEARCMLWRAEGYTRCALHLLAPRLFAQRAFLERLEFRTERELFAP